MKLHILSARLRKARLWRLAFGLSALAWLASGDVLHAQLSGVARVEEDWQLVVSVPESSDNSPQITCVISPSVLTNGYAALDMNFYSQPDYSPGGIQLHVWSPTTPMLISNSAVRGMLQNQNETITWTTRMSLSNNTLTFSVVNGQSESWGKFGLNGHLSLSVGAAISDLSTYDPNVSLSNSGVPYASNRVTSLTLKAVRWYSASGVLLQQNTAPQAVSLN